MSKGRFNLVGLPSLLIVGIASGLPLIWVVGVVLRRPGTMADFWLSPYRLKLLGHTIAYNGLAALTAVAMGLLAGWVMGRSRGWLGKALWVLAPGTLLFPFLAFRFGWLQAFQMTNEIWKALGITFFPGSAGDVLRCCWILGSWLWGVPALIVALALRHLDQNLELAGWSDGRLLRTTFRALSAPLILSWAASFMLASQGFAVYEPTGIPVTATEVRMVFATGAFSFAPGEMPNQEERAAAAVATALPMLLVTALLCLLANKMARRFDFRMRVYQRSWPRVLDAPAWAAAIAAALAVLNFGVPLFALLKSIKGVDSPAALLSEFGGAAAGSGLLFTVVMAVAGVLAFSASAWPSRGLLTLACVSFLLGGEMLAIALIRIFNRPGLDWVYHAWPLPCIAYIGRFGCLGLLAARFAWSPAWRNLRIQAAHDGAGAGFIASRIVWPLAWPIFLAAALLVGILSLGEVDATATLVPEHPAVLTTVLLTMANATRSNRFVEGALVSVILALAGAAVLLLCWRLWLLSSNWRIRRD